MVGVPCRNDGPCPMEAETLKLVSATRKPETRPFQRTDLGDQNCHGKPQPIRLFGKPPSRGWPPSRIKQEGAPRLSQVNVRKQLRKGLSGKDTRQTKIQKRLDQLKKEVGGE
ncbi:unnamed protein product [Effrenium voratum]|nr:unnamed protein product [Effrenium voratum]